MNLAIDDQHPAYPSDSKSCSRICSSLRCADSAQWLFEWGRFRRLAKAGGGRPVETSEPSPLRLRIEQFLDEYLDAVGIREGGKTPLFRSALGRTGILTDRPMHRVDAYQMVRRRTAEAGLQGKLGCHVFRATGITAYLEAGGTLENAQAMAAHESPRTTKLYDRTGDEITLDEVERITI